MGTDIHGFTELKVNGEWLMWSQWSIARDYQLFALLAGLRNRDDVVPVVPPKGLPSSLSKVGELLLALDFNQGHTHSWLTVEELRVLKQRYEQLEGATEEDTFAWYYEMDPRMEFFSADEFLDCQREASEVGHEVSDVRFVFWFDN